MAVLPKKSPESLPRPRTYATDLPASVETILIRCLQPKPENRYPTADDLAILRILTYHRVADPTREPYLNPRLISATPAEFARHVHFLARHYRVLGLEDVLVAYETGRRLPRRAVLITFDDAYRDFMEVAWPILLAHRLPATVFVPTAYPGWPERAFWWDRLHRCCTDPTRPELVLPSLGALPLRTQEERLAALHAAAREVKKFPHDRAMTLIEEICDQLGEDDLAYPSVLDWDELRMLAHDSSCWDLASSSTAYARERPQHRSADGSQPFTSAAIRAPTAAGPGR